MEESVTPLSVLGPHCDTQRERIRKLFDNGASAQDTLRQLCELADEVIQRVFAELLRVGNSSGQGLCLLALGGYGREMLFPYSDLDLLFLFGNEKAESESRPLIAEFSRTLWDLGFRVSSAGRCWTGASWPATKRCSKSSTPRYCLARNASRGHSCFLSCSD